MANILLLGAGFSKNWGAPLTSEFFDNLIGDQGIVANGRARQVLLAENNFEEALDILQRQARNNEPNAKPALAALLAGMKKVFDRMYETFVEHPFEVQQSVELTVKRFLENFQVIFTLNQDLLLEHHFFQRTDHWKGGDLPGMRPTGHEEPGHPWTSRTWVPDGEMQPALNSQPYYKLHGSINWKTADNGDIMIIGRGKETTIAQYPVLAAYQQVFESHLTHADTRLTIVGYSFSDAHINAIIKKGVESGLTFFIIDPRGPEIGKSLRKTPPGAIGHGPCEEEEWINAGVRGYGRTYLPTLLAQAGMEYKRLMDFLTGK